MKDITKLKESVLKEEDYIYSPKYGNSVKNLISFFPDGLPLDKIARVMLMSEDEVKEIYKSAIQKLRQLMRY